MRNEIFFALREFCEVLALKTVIDHCKSLGLEFRWNIFAFPVNTDFNHYNLSIAFSELHDVLVVKSFDEKLLSRVKLFGFATDMRHDLDRYMKDQFSCTEMAACRLYSSPPSQRDIPVLVIGNVKVKSPVEDFQEEIFRKLSSLPYETIVVPRHPLNSEEMKSIRIPPPIRFMNTMGKLEDLHATANLTVMGRIFSANGLEPDDDHNPLEATINSHTLCGVIKEIPKPFEWLYEESGLIHQYHTLEEIYEGIDRWIKDPDLLEKLAKRDKWVRSNREKYLEKVVKKLTS